MATNLYNYAGKKNLSASELFFYVTIDEACKQLGITDVISVSAVISGQPILPTRARIGGAIKGTSPASLASRALLDYNVKTRLPMLAGNTPLSLKIRFTRNLGAFVGRSIPMVGWVVMGYDVTMISINSVRSYNRIATPEDQIF